MEKSKLQQHYEDVLQYEIATILDSEFLQKKYELTEFGASCLMYMLVNNEYCPELEDIYTENRDTFEGEDNEIKFIEDMPPYSKFDMGKSDLSLADKESYIADGFAQWMSFEDQRQWHIKLIVEFSRILNQHEADIREALTLRNEDFFKDYYKDYDEEKIIEHMKNLEFTEDEITIALELVS